MLTTDEPSNLTSREARAVAKVNAAYRTVFIMGVTKAHTFDDGISYNMPVYLNLRRGQVTMWRGNKSNSLT